MAFAHAHYWTKEVVHYRMPASWKPLLFVCFKSKDILRVRPSVTAKMLRLKKSALASYDSDILNLTNSFDSTKFSKEWHVQRKQRNGPGTSDCLLTLSFKMYVTRNFHFSSRWLGIENIINWDMNISPKQLHVLSCSKHANFTLKWDLNWAKKHVFLTKKEHFMSYTL